MVFFNEKDIIKGHFPNGEKQCDETNKVTQINPGFAYIFPTDGEKIVKVVFEGQTRLDEFRGRDRSSEIEVYKKIGVPILKDLAEDRIKED